MDDLVTRVIAYYNKLRDANISQSAAEDMTRDWQSGMLDIEREKIVARTSGIDAHTIALAVVEQLEINTRTRR